MIALLAKDWRLNRAPVIASILILVLPYLFAITISAYTIHRMIANPGEVSYRDPSPREVTAENLAKSSFIILSVLTLVSPVYGAIAFAHERRERSADFLAMLPVARVKIVISKAIIAASCIGVPFMIDLLILKVCQILWERTYSEDIWIHIGIFGGISFMMFGIAWLCSAFLSSPAISFSIALGITLSAFFLIMGLWSYQEDSNAWEMILLAGAYLTGALCLIGGSIYWLYRIEP